MVYERLHIVFIKHSCYLSARDVSGILHQRLTLKVANKKSKVFMTILFVRSVKVNAWLRALSVLLRASYLNLLNVQVGVLDVK
jgi:hypothetical protein